VIFGAVGCKSLVIRDLRLENGPTRRSEPESHRAGLWKSLWKTLWKTGEVHVKPSTSAFFAHSQTSVVSLLFSMICPYVIDRQNLGFVNPGSGVHNP
jgi:hypothetical protein